MRCTKTSGQFGADAVTAKVSAGRFAPRATSRERSKRFHSIATNRACCPAPRPQMPLGDRDPVRRRRCLLLGCWRRRAGVRGLPKRCRPTTNVTGYFPARRRTHQGGSGPRIRRWVRYLAGHQVIPYRSALRLKSDNACLSYGLAGRASLRGFGVIANYGEPIVVAAGCGGGSEATTLACATVLAACF